MSTSVFCLAACKADHTRRTCSKNQNVHLIKISHSFLAIRMTSPYSFFICRLRQAGQRSSSAPIRGCPCLDTELVQRAHAHPLLTIFHSPHSVQRHGKISLDGNEASVSGIWNSMMGEHRVQAEFNTGSFMQQNSRYPSFTRHLSP